MKTFKKNKTSSQEFSQNGKAGFLSLGLRTIFGEKRGTAIAYALVIVAIMSILLTSVMQFVVTQLKFGYYDESKQEAFEIAEAGVFWYRWYLAHQTDGRNAQQIKAFWQTGSPLGVGPAYTVNYKDPWSGENIGAYSISVEAPDPGSTIATAIVTGWTNKYPEVKRRIKVRFRRPAWSEYMMLSDAPISYGTTAFVQGKVFGNNGVHFDGVATNTVTSAVGSYYDTSENATKPGVWTSWAGNPARNTTQNSDVFLAGNIFPTSPKLFTTVSADLKLMHDDSKDPTRGYFFAGNKKGWHIILQGSNFQIREVEKISTSAPTQGDWKNYVAGSSWATYPIPDDGIIFVENNVWVEGVIDNKRVTITSGNIDGEGQGNSNVKFAMYIKNDITFTNYDGKDVLGLVSQNDIEFTQNSDTNLEIDAAMLAIDGKIYRPFYSDSKNSLKIFGALATYERSGFAYTVSGNTYGYQARTYVYDNNLLYVPPPYFPTGNQYLIDLWDEL